MFLGIQYQRTGRLGAPNCWHKCFLLSSTTNQYLVIEPTCIINRLLSHLPDPIPIHHYHNRQRRLHPTQLCIVQWEKQRDEPIDRDDSCQVLIRHVQRVWHADCPGLQVVTEQIFSAVRILNWDVEVTWSLRESHWNEDSQVICDEHVDVDSGAHHTNHVERRPLLLLFQEDVDD